MIEGVDVGVAEVDNGLVFGSDGGRQAAPGLLRIELA
jgi:hypothetical protein